MHPLPTGRPALRKRGWPRAANVPQTGNDDNIKPTFSAAYRAATNTDNPTTNTPFCRSPLIPTKANPGSRYNVLP